LRERALDYPPFRAVTASSGGWAYPLSIGTSRTATERRGRTRRRRRPPAPAGARTLRLVAGAACLVAALSLASAAHAQDAEAIVGLRLDGVVDPFIADHLRGQIEQAQIDDAPAVLLTIDTPGGLGSSMREITQAIMGSDVPVIGYVSPEGARAASAGAFVLLSCPVAAMAPGTNVGAATPVGISGVVENEKATNDAAASIYSIADTYGRNAELAETFVTDAASISAQEALDENVIDVIAPSTDVLLGDLAGTTVTLADGSTVTLPQDLAERPIDERSMSPLVGFLHELFDPNLAFLFFWLGLALIVLELLVPGHIFSGTVGTILLIIAVVSFGLLPVRLAGILLLIAAVALLLVELSAPGLGVWGIAGIVCLVLGGVFLFNGSGGVHVSPVVIALVAIGAALFFGIAVSKVLQIRKLPAAQGPDVIVGREGVVVGDGIGPDGGVVRVAAEEWRARSDAAPLPGGTPVTVTALDGLVLTVEPLPHEDATAAVPTPATEGGNDR
jgi:membrane-bound serine protease (ClpP class)